MGRMASVVVYDTEPATEWLLGSAVRKMSPRYSHARVQATLAVLLDGWALTHGRIGSEWRFWVSPAGEPERYLVPDFAFLSFDRLPREARAQAEEPHVAPDVVFEILSTGDRPNVVAHKIAVYLSAGTSAVIVIDPNARTAIVHDRGGERSIAGDAVLRHAALPGLDLPLARLFAKLDA